MQRIVFTVPILAYCFAILMARPMGLRKPVYRKVRIPQHARNATIPDCTSVFKHTDRLVGRNGEINRNRRWARFDVRPDNNFAQWELTQIQNAMATLSNVLPCINFGYWVPNSSPTVRDWVRIYKGGGCSSIVGRWGGVQTLSLASPGCTNHVGTIMHELIHALGIHHEMQRPDRDRYITIYWQNTVAPSQFNLLSSSQVSDFGQPYNIRSIMHYGSYSFSNGNPTMVDKNGNIFYETRQLQGTDIQKLKNMYGCR